MHSSEWHLAFLNKKLQRNVSLVVHLCFGAVTEGFSHIQLSEHKRHLLSSEDFWNPASSHPFTVLHRFLERMQEARVRTRLDWICISTFGMHKLKAKEIKTAQWGIKSSAKQICCTELFSKFSHYWFSREPFLIMTKASPQKCTLFCN